MLTSVRVEVGLLSTHEHTHIHSTHTQAGDARWWSWGQWITDLSFIIPWLSVTFKKPLTPVRFTLVYISYGSTHPTHITHIHPACHSLTRVLCVCVCVISAITQSPNDTDRAVNYTLISFSHLPSFSVRLKKIDPACCCWYDASSDALIDLLLNEHFGHWYLWSECRLCPSATPPPPPHTHTHTEGDKWIISGCCVVWLPLCMVIIHRFSHIYTGLL